MADEKHACYKQNIVLIFLDVDGVLNTNNRDKTKTNKAALCILRTHAERLKEIITATNIECKICISSAWRLNKYSLQMLNKNLMSMADIDVDKIVIGKTPFIPYNNNIQNSIQQRICEIRSYLNDDKILNSKYNVITICVVDDLDLSGLGNNFVHINPQYGLTETNAHHILSILNQDNQGKEKLMQFKSKPRIKLLFIAALQNNYNNINSKRLQIIVKKTECLLVIKQEYYNNIYNNPSNTIPIDCFTQIVQYTTDLEQKYNIQSWAVLDYINIQQNYSHHSTLITRRFVKVDPHKDLSLNDVLDTISILNKWS